MARASAGRLRRPGHGPASAGFPRAPAACLRAHGFPGICRPCPAPRHPAAAPPVPGLATDRPRRPRLSRRHRRGPAQMRRRPRSRDPPSGARRTRRGRRHSGHCLHGPARRRPSTPAVRPPRRPRLLRGQPRDRGRPHRRTLPGQPSRLLDRRGTAPPGRPLARRLPDRRRRHVRRGVHRPRGGRPRASPAARPDARHRRHLRQPGTTGGAGRRPGPHAERPLGADQSRPARGAGRRLRPRGDPPADRGLQLQRHRCPRLSAPGRLHARSAPADRHHRQPHPARDG